MATTASMREELEEGEEEGEAAAGAATGAAIGDAARVCERKKSVRRIGWLLPIFGMGRKEKRERKR